MKKKKPQGQQFPNNSRIITENHISYLRKALIVSVACTLFFAFTLLGMDMAKTLRAKQQNEIKRAQLLKEEQYWQVVIQSNPSYRDAYFNLALVFYQLRNYENAKNYAEKTLAIDPNYGPARKLEKILKTM